MIVWVDVETTGLNPQSDLLLEVAIIVTDMSPELPELGRLHWLVAHDRATLESHVEACDEKVFEMHMVSGLWLDLGLLSHTGVPAELPVWDTDTALAQMSEFFTKLEVFGRGSKHPLGGSTPSFDRGFLRAEYPEIEAQFSHRHVDVTSLEIFGTSFRLNLPGRSPTTRHRAVDDIESSINLARKTSRFLRSHMRSHNEDLICRQ